MKKIAVIFGSMSSEHSVSCISAGNILQNIDKNKYHVEKIGIDKSGNWYLYTGSNENILENKWLEDNDNKIKIENLNETLKKFDVIFPVLHGKYGEDGTVQGIFEMAKVKYIGCKVLGSSISMNKTLSKELAKTKGIPVVPYLNITREEYQNILKDEIKKEKFLNDITINLGTSLFVKPNREGSSYGVSKVDKKEQILDAIKHSLEYDDSSLIETYIKDKKEVECAVIVNDKEIITSTPGEIVIKGEVYDFESKYNDKTSYTKIPADISDDIIDKIKKYAKEVFKVLRLDGLSRVDFFVTSKNEIYFNEVNTLPGFTNSSMYPQMLIHDGYEYSKIIEILIENCN